MHSKYFPNFFNSFWNIKNHHPPISIPFFRFIDFYDISEYVRILMAHSVDNEDELKSKFGI